MPKKKTEAQVINQNKITDDIYDLRLDTDLAKDAKPGQFVGVYTRDLATLLPRPLSICEADAKSNRLRLVYRLAGSGTREFATLKAGDSVSVLGVLGNGFPVERAAGQRVCLFGGGIGIPPLLELSKAIHEKAASLSIMLGYRDSQTFLAREFSAYGRVYIASEDGSVGVRGHVLDAVKEMDTACDLIMACGPLPMLRAVKAYAKDTGAAAFISLEERMACGVGACLGCVARTAEPNHHTQVHNARICTEGPVFDAEEVCL